MMLMCEGMSTRKAPFEHGTSEYDSRLQCARHNEDRARNPVGHTSLVQHLLYLPYTLIVAKHSGSTLDKLDSTPTQGLNQRGW